MAFCGPLSAPEEKEEEKEDKGKEEEEKKKRKVPVKIFSKEITGESAASPREADDEEHLEWVAVLCLACLSTSFLSPTYC